MTLYHEAVVNEKELDSIFKMINEVVHFNKCYYRVFSVDCDYLKTCNLYKVKIGFMPHILTQEEFNSKNESHRRQDIYLHSLPWYVPNAGA